MSDIKNILAVMTDPVAGRLALVAALHAGQYLRAHVDALHVRTSPVQTLPMVGEAMTGAMVDELTTLAEHEAARRAEKVRAVFDECIKDGGDAAWLEDTGFAEQIIGLRGCRADLIVLPRPPREQGPDSLATLNTALMQSGRPVLAAPLGDGDIKGFKNIAVFWNASTEATRAVTAALPFLVKAEKVTVLRVEEEEWSAPTDDLAAYLGYHGVPFTTQILPKKGRTGEVLLAGAAAVGAGLLVMGAYTRSKFRQLILGSVTGYVVHNARLPVLLCH